MGGRSLVPRHRREIKERTRYDARMGISAWMGRDLEWVSVRRFGRRYALHAGDETVATLTIAGVFRRAAELEAPGLRWRFEATSWLRRDVRVIENGRTLAEHRGRWPGRGTLTRFDPPTDAAAGAIGSASGAAHGWEWRHAWFRHWRFEDADGPVVQMWRRPAWLRVRAGARVERESLATRDALLLLATGFYLMLRARRGRA